MMSTFTRRLTRGMACGIILLVARPASADGGCNRGCGGRFGPSACNHKSRVDVDIESLKARLSRRGGRWELRVRYDVEIEDARPAERFDLVLRVTERGRGLRDRSGRALGFVVPLRRPTEVERDEVEYERSITLQLPNGSFRRPKDLRLWAKVLRRQDGRVFDREDKSIDYDGRRHRRMKISTTRSRTTVRRTAHTTIVTRARSVLHRQRGLRTSVRVVVRR